MSDEKEKPLSELLQVRGEAKLALPALIEKFRGEEITTRNLIDLQKRIIDDSQMILPLPFVQMIEEIEKRVREKLDSQK